MNQHFLYVTVDTNVAQTSQYASFRWKDKVDRDRPVPEMWKFPTASVKAMCDMFVFGIPCDRIRPFREFKGSALNRKDASNFYKAEYVFNHIIDRASSDESIAFDIQQLDTITLIQWDQVFENIFPKVVAALPKKTRKPGEISIVTFYDKLH